MADSPVYGIPQWPPQAGETGTHIPGFSPPDAAGSDELSLLVWPQLVEGLGSECQSHPVSLNRKALHNVRDMEM